MFTHYWVLFVRSTSFEVHFKVHWAKLCSCLIPLLIILCSIVKVYLVVQQVNAVKHNIPAWRDYILRHFRHLAAQPTWAVFRLVSVGNAFSLTTSMDVGHQMPWSFQCPAENQVKMTTKCKCYSYFSIFRNIPVFSNRDMKNLTLDFF